MKPDNVKAIISLVLVIAFVITSSLLAIIPPLTGAPAGEYTEQLQNYWTLYSGVIGVIIGYYFGKKEKPGNRETQ